MVKNPPVMQEMQDLIPGSGRYSGEGNGNLLQYTCLENSMDRRGWWATVHVVMKSGGMTTKLVEVMEFQLSYFKS